MTGSGSVVTGRLYIDVKQDVNNNNNNNNNDCQFRKRNPSRPIDLCSSGFQYLQSACRYFTTDQIYITAS